MKWLLFPLTLLTLLAPLRAATTLVSYGGGVDPTTQGWTKSSSNSNVVGSAYDDGGRSVWRIHDPGLGRPTTADPVNNLYYQRTFNSTQVSNLRSQGWEMSAVIQLPTQDPYSNGALNPGSDSWLGFIHANPNDSKSRLLFAFVFGRTLEGQTIISINGVNNSAVTLDPGYHQVKMVYDPSTELASVFINDQYQRSYGGSLASSTGSNVIYWGDNSAQTSPSLPRTTYYESVSFLMVPEVSITQLCALTLLGWCVFIRRRSL